MTRLNVDEDDFYYPGDGSPVDKLREKIEQFPEDQLVALVQEMKTVKPKSIQNVTVGFARRHISTETIWLLVEEYFGTTDTRTAPFAMMSLEDSNWFKGFLKSKYAPAELLTYCLNDQYRAYLYYFALGHPASPINLVTKAIYEAKIYLRYAASHPKLPRDYIQECVESPDRISRENVASNPSATTEDLYKLSQDEAFMVRLLVTENPSTPGWILFESLKSTDPTISTNAKGKVMRAEKDVFLSWFTEEQKETIKNLPRDWVVKMVLNGVIDCRPNTFVNG